MLRAKIAGTGSYLPEKILTNADLEKIVDTSDEWITTRTGIKERHIISEGETTSSLALIARKSNRIRRCQYRWNWLHTCGNDHTWHEFSFYRMHSAGQASDPELYGYGLYCSCSGFIYGLHIANSLIATESAKCILVIGAETLSTITDYTDRNTCVLFGTAPERWF